MHCKRFLVAGLLFVISGFSYGQTYVEGNVSGTWSPSGNPYVVIGSCTVQNGTTLTINPGVRVLFDGTFYIRSYGTLIAEGTRTDSILFTSNEMIPSVGDWRHIRLTGSGSSNSRFKFCEISFAEDCIWAEDTQVDIQKCFLHHSETGINIDNTTANIQRCTIDDNQDQGVSASNCPNVTIEHCNIRRNNDEGIRITKTSGSAEGLIQWNTIINNGLHGIYASNINPLTINRNIIARNTGCGMYLTNCHVTAWNNTISQNGLHGVFFWNSELSLVNGIIDRNQGGYGLYNQNSTYSIWYCDVWQNDSGDYFNCACSVGCISEDPMYANIFSDFHLLEGSPCIDTGSPVAPDDPDGTRADMGALYFDQNTPPEIIDFRPEVLTGVNQGDEVSFWISAIDADGDSLRYQWWHYGEIVGEDSIVNIQFTQAGLDTVVGKALDGWGGGVDSVVWDEIAVDVSISQTDPVPKEMLLGQAYPNPFNASTVIPFQVAVSGLVTVTVFDVLGREVTELFRKEAIPGEYRVVWSAEDFPSGIYFVGLKTGVESQVRKVVLLK